MRIGILKLTDAAPVIMAQELGLFEAEGIDVKLSIEPSWANIADKLVHGFLDAAVIVPPLAFAVALGLRGSASAVIIPQALSLGGNTVTLETSLARAVERHLTSEQPGALAKAKAFAAALKSQPGKPVLAVVHVYSTHNLLLRYWLAAGGINPDDDVELIVVPPAQTAEALATGRISGFCAGAPWGAVAESKGVGQTIATSQEIWRNGSEKALAVGEDWANEHPDDLQSLLRALLRSAQFCDLPANSIAIAQTLSEEAFLGVEAANILGSLPQAGTPASSIFFRNAATFPWHSHAQWFLRQMARWDLVGADTDFAGVAARVYRPDLYASAARSVGVSVPIASVKAEDHAAPWQCPAEPSPIAMEPDGFCDTENM